MSISSLIVFVLQCLPVFFWADDFFLYNQIKEVGLWPTMEKLYLEWDGRFISLNAAVQLLLISTNLPWLVVLVWKMMFILLAVSVLHIIHDYTFPKTKHILGEGLIKQVFFLITIWLAFYHHLADILYWTTGGIYTMSLAMSAVFIWIFIRHNTKSNIWFLILMGLFGLALGMMGVMAASHLLVFLAIQILTNRQKDWKEYRPMFIVVLVSGSTILAGSVFNMLAPGNFIRASILPTSFNWDIQSLALNFLKIGYRYIHQNLITFLMATAGSVAFFLALGYSINRKLSLKEFLLGNSLKTFFIQYQWFFIAVSGIIPMLAIPDFAGGRTGIYFSLYVFIGVWTTIARLFTKPFNSIEYHSKSHESKLFKWLGFYLIIIIGIVLMSYHFYYGYQIRKQVTAREQFLESRQGLTESITVDPIRVKRIPKSVFFLDLLDDDYAQYYGFKKISLNPDSFDSLPDYYLNPKWGPVHQKE